MNQMANQMSDQAIATDLLLSAKAGVRNCALALTEATTDEVRKTLNQQLQQAIIFQQRVADYMITQGYYQPYNLDEQVQVDKMTAQSVIQYSQQPNTNMMQQSMNTNQQQPANNDPSFYEQTEGMANPSYQQSTTAGQQSNQTPKGTPQIDLDVTIENDTHTPTAYEQSAEVDEQYYEMAHEFDDKQFLLPEGKEQTPSKE